MRSTRAARPQPPRFRLTLLLLGCLPAASRDRLEAQQPLAQEPSCDPVGLDKLLTGESDAGMQLVVAYRDESAAGLAACLQCTASFSTDAEACAACAQWSGQWPNQRDQLMTTSAEQALDGLVYGADAMSGLLFPQPYSETLASLATKFFYFDDEPIIRDGMAYIAAAYAYPDCIAVDTYWIRPSYAAGVAYTVDQTLHHELFHMVQRRFVAGINVGADATDPTTPSRFGAWVSEGQARLVPERLSFLADWLVDSQFRSSVTAYLLERTHVPLVEASYDAALFWSYACEQLGAGQDNPGQGVDFVSAFWGSPFWNGVASQNPIDSAGAFEERLQAEGRGPLAAFFHDFAVACYTHDLAAPGPDLPTPERHRFLDELDPTVTQPSSFTGTAQGPPLPYEPVARECYCVESSGCPSQEQPVDACSEISLPWHGAPDLEAFDKCIEESAASLSACADCVASEEANAEACDACDDWKAACRVADRFYVKALAAEHHELNLSRFELKPCRALDLRARACSPVYWSLVAVDGAGSPRRLWTERGELFARTLVDIEEQNLERLALIASGEATDTPFEVWLDEVELDLSIVLPTTDQPARPGPASEPGSFLVRVAVDGPLPVPAPEAWPDVADPPTLIGGLRREDFRVAITDASGFRSFATVVSALFTGGEYVLLVNAPGGLQDRVYDLEVKLVGGDCPTTTATVEGGIRFAATPVNHALVLDASASMGSPAGSTRLAAAQSAAKLYIDGVGSRDRVGLVIFRGDDDNCTDNSTIELAMTEAIPAVRGATGTAAAAIDSITASGLTSIGDGVTRARRMLRDIARADEPREMVVLSDGGENEGRYLFNPAVCPDTSVIDRATLNWDETGIALNAIGIGPGCDEGLLNQLVLQGAEPRLPWFIDASSSGGGGGGAFSDGLSLANRLADVFVRSLERSTRRERLAFTARKLRANVSATASLDLEIAPGARDGMFFFHWDPPSAMTLRLRDPSGQEQTATAVDRFESSTHAVLNLRARTALTPGVWTAEMTSFTDVELIAGCLARDPEDLKVSLDVSQGPGTPPGGRGPGFFVQGLPVTLLATIADERGIVRGAEVTVTVETPGGKALGGLCNGLRLLDDGAHNDGQADDGVYGLIFRQTLEASEGAPDGDDAGAPVVAGERGSYIVAGLARGRTESGTEFARPVECHFHVTPSDKDTDGDDMIDVWEQHYGTQWQVADQNADPDRDGLFNRNEYHNGTDPLNADTDGNGEIDSSEMRRGRCPIDPADDTIAQPVDVEVVKSDFDVGPPLLREGALLLRFPVMPGQASLRIFRATGKASNPFTLLATLSGAELGDALHHDESVSPGTVYFYRFQAVGADGSESALSRIVHGSLPGEPGPIFDAVLQNGATVLDTLDVELRLVRSTPAKYFRIASRPLTGKEPLQALPARPIPFRFETPPTRPALLHVYLELYDARGNASGTLMRSIVFDPTGDLDGDRLVNSRDADDDGDGLDDDAELRAGTNPTVPDTDGDGDLDGVDSDPLNPGVRGAGGGSRFLRADANTDGRLDLSDAVSVLGYLFLGTAAPECEKSADANDSSNIDITDAVYILEFLFAGGRAPPPPGLTCGVDPTADRLSCEAHRPCR